MKKLKKTFRWFGDGFGVELEHIKQLGATGIVTACHHIPAGEVWERSEIATIKNKIERSGLEWSVVESVNVHNAIKKGSDDRDAYIEKYIETLKNLAQEQIYVVCYNFMPVLDWTRTQLDYRLSNGASALFFNHIDLVAFDRYILKREGAEADYDPALWEKSEPYFDNLNDAERLTLQNTLLAGLPGTRDVISLADFRKHLAAYEGMDRAALKENYAYFLKAVIPEAEKLGIKMCVHPDDPPFNILGLPRVVTSMEDLEFVVNAAPSPSNGITYCTGSLGAGPSNDLVAILDKIAPNIHFLHLRNVARQADGSFYESDHLDGSVPMVKVMQRIIEEQQRRDKSGEIVDIPVRPDHGHVILDDLNRMRDFYPGYSALGRGKGLAELSGLEMGLRSLMGIE